MDDFSARAITAEEFEQSWAVALTVTPRPDTGRPYAPSSIERALAAVRTAHRAADLLPPESRGTRLVLRGYNAPAPWTPPDRTRKATPALPKTRRFTLAELDRDTLAGKRDAALLLLGFATAFTKCPASDHELATTST